MRVPFVDLRAQQSIVQEDLLSAAERIIRDASFILGQEVANFEDDFAAYCGVDYAVGVDSGHSALKLALLAFGVGEGDEVLVPANTFIATAAAVTYAGATPVPVDIESDSFQMNPEMIEAAITPRTRAIIPVHLYGTPAEMDAIGAIASKHNLIVIEDAAQAHGSKYHGKRIGGFGHAAAFSFYPAKNLGACGDAGMVVTNDGAAAERIRGMRNVGQLQKNVHTLPPHNHRLDTMQAAFLRVKLPYIDEWNANRSKLAKAYDEGLKGSDIVAPKILDYADQVWHLYVVRSKNRDALQAALQQYDIATGIHYPTPIHLHPFYASLGYKVGDFPVAEARAGEILSLPMYETMDLDAVDYIVKAIREFQPEPT